MQRITFACSERNCGRTSTSLPVLPDLHVPYTRRLQPQKHHHSQILQPARLIQCSASTSSAEVTDGKRRSVLLSKAVPSNSYHPVTEGFMPVYVTLDKDVLNSSNELAYPEALKSGLKSLRALGVAGVHCDVWWGLVEGRPEQYDWSGYKQLFQIVKDAGLKIKVGMCFHSGTQSIQLPDWVLEEGRSNPDIFYTDKAGGRCMECLSMGINELPVMRGRTGVQLYQDFMSAFKAEFRPLLGSTITECLIGLGPSGELKYPAHPFMDKRWTFPGVGEFQCYDKFMLATLKACAEQVSQPSWGLGGPHDAGSYCLWPHQTGFFHQNGNWSSPYGKFFLQWYAEMLMRHADQVLEAACGVFRDTQVSLSVRVPSCHWWHNTAAHAPELTAGIYNLQGRDGYLPLFKVLARHRVSVRLGLADLRSYEHSGQAFCDPDKLLLQQRTVAAALNLPMCLENVMPRFEEASLGRLEACMFDMPTNQGIELPQAQGLTFNVMNETMYEPNNWRAFKAFVQRVRARADASAPGPNGSGSSMQSHDVPVVPTDGKAVGRGRPVFA